MKIFRSSRKPKGRDVIQTGRERHTNHIMVEVRKQARSICRHQDPIFKLAGYEVHHRTGLKPVNRVRGKHSHHVGDCVSNQQQHTSAAPSSPDNQFEGAGIFI